jgi:hypothetical protein
MAGTTTYYGISYPTSTDYVKDGATAIQTVATGFDSAVAIPTYNAQTGATYTFVLSDTGKVVTASNAAATIYTIPPTASVAWTANTTLRVLNLGAGVVTFAAGAGVTVTNTAQTLAQYQSAQLVRTGLNAWTVTPDSGQSTSGMTLITTSTFTSVASVSVNNCFTATYSNYRIVIKANNSLGVDPRFRYRVGGVDATGVDYTRQAILSNGGTLSSNTSNDAFGYLAINGTTATNAIFMDLMDVAVASPTYENHITHQATNYVNFLQTYHSLSTAYDGITVFPSSGNISGVISVYGYNK